MPTIGGKFAGLSHLDSNARVQFGGPLGNLQEVGKQKTGFLSGLKNRFATISDADKVKNKEVTKAFVRQIVKDFGMGAARMILGEVRDDFAAGRPLTAGQIKNVLAKAGEAHDKLLTRDMKAAGFTPDEISVAIKHNFTLNQALSYKKADIPIHERTVVRSYGEDNVKGEPRKLSGGAVSVPFHVKFETRDGFKHDGVYKKAGGPEGLCRSGETVLGISKDRPMLAVRNIASKVVDDALGMNLLPRTEIGKVKGELGVVLAMAPGKSGQRMEESVLEGAEHNKFLSLAVDDDGKLTAEGRNTLNDMGIGIRGGTREDDPIVLFRQTPRPHAETHNTADPELRKGLVGLQILDALTGQIDRHPGNFFISKDASGKTTVKGIDNDNAFGPRCTNPDSLKGLNNKGLPPVIDTDMAASIRGLTAEKLRADLKGLLPGPEIDAAVSRLAAMQQHVGHLEQSGNVIRPDQWGGEVATRQLQSSKDSYVGVLIMLQTPPTPPTPVPPTPPSVLA